MWREGNPLVEAFAEWTQSNEGQRIVMDHYVGIPNVVSTAQAEEPSGALEVYTVTTPVEDAGLMFYPYSAYNVTSLDGELVRHVPNRLGDYDEKPSRILLSPGQYIIRPEIPVRGITELSVSIEAGQTTRVNLENLNPEDIGGPSQTPSPATAGEKENRLRFYGDMRFRAELDFDGERSNGNDYDDRFRLRYRARLGFYYRWSNYVGFGARIRSGNISDQQGPHVTLGGDAGEFGLIPLGFDKAFIELKHPRIKGWVGKNNFPFWKQNELYWNDNTIPEGAFAGTRVHLTKNKSTTLHLRAGHFVVRHSGRLLNEDAFLSAGQAHLVYTGKRIGLNLASGFFYFNNVPLVPDGSLQTGVDYPISITSAELKFGANRPMAVGLDYLHNFDDSGYNDTPDWPYAGENTGMVLNLKYGSLQRKGDFLVHLYLASLERYSAVDYFAQNDWARWDYSSFGVAGSRLTNFQGVELRCGYAFGKRFKVVARGYLVEELVATGAGRAYGSRARIDLDIGF